MGYNGDYDVFPLPLGKAKKSKYIESFIEKHDDISFVRLHDTSADSFRSIKEFLMDDEYNPKLTTIRDDPRSAATRALLGTTEENPPTRAYTYRFALEGLTSDRQVVSELQRTSFLYLLVRRFEIPAMQRLIVRKVRLVLSNIGLLHMISFAKLVFINTDPTDPFEYLSESQSRGLRYLRNERNGPTKLDRDPMRTWLIKWLAQSMACITRIDSSGFWKFMNANPHIRAAVFLQAAEMGSGHDHSMDSVKPSKPQRFVVRDPPEGTPGPSTQEEEESSPESTQDDQPHSTEIGQEGAIGEPAAEA